MADGSHPVFWNTDGIVTVLDAASGLTVSNIRINGAGQVMWTARRIEDDYYVSPHQVFKWSETGGLSTLPFLVGTESAMAVALNDLWEIVGYSGKRAAVWNDDDSRINLGAATPEDFVYMYDINNKAQIASSFTPSPEPSSLLELLAGLGGVSTGLRWRKR